jgi:hypothetical protein
VHEVEERKNAHIAELMARHRRAFEEVKNYYNDITHNNLDLIKAGGPAAARVPGWALVARGCCCTRLGCSRVGAGMRASEAPAAPADCH